MHKNKQFNQMVIYMEACESGSMFMNYPDDWKGKQQLVHYSNLIAVVDAEGCLGVPGGA